MLDANRAIVNIPVLTRTVPPPYDSEKVKQRMEDIRRHIRSCPVSLLRPFFYLSEVSTRSKDSRVLLPRLIEHDRSPLGRLVASDHPNVKVTLCRVELYSRTKFIQKIQLIMPRVLRTALGTFHPKVQVVDDTVLLTGANLGEDYFTDRKDRCLMVESPSLADSLCRWSDFVSRPDWSSPFVMNEVFISSRVIHESQRLLKRQETEEQRQLRISEHEDKDYQAVVLPRLSHWSKQTADTDGCDVIHGDAQISRTITRYGLPTLFATSYFNPNKSLLKMLAGRSEGMNGEELNALGYGKSLMVTSSRECNSFNRGYKSIIPQLYESIASNIDWTQLPYWKFLEYNSRGPGSFHAKGLWWLPTPSPAGSPQSPKAITDVGSSNYGNRSEGRDLEMNFLLKTRDLKEINSLQREANEIIKHCNPPKDRQFGGGFRALVRALSRNRFILSLL
eukprot:GHVH01008353.1.p1 GENE.GHVH01008353.1~~GHVH01008353.1.p1  ORF type:complete len:448 (+),score=44.35 GHVH01008353.1:462-1805(+)